MTTLIVGHTGFLGRNLYQVLPGSYCLNSQGIFIYNRKVNVKIEELFEKGKINTVINCAVSYSEDNHNEIMQTNFELPMYILLLCEKFDVTFITFGSFFEKYSGEYKANYINSKLRFRDKFNEIEYRKKYYLQLEHIFGRFDSPQKFIPSVVNKIKYGETIHLDDPFTKRDFTPIEYVLKSTLYVMNNVPSEQCYDVGTTEKTTTINFIKRLYKFYHGTDENFIDKVHVRTPNNPLDVVRSSCAVNVIQEIMPSDEEKCILMNSAISDLF